MADQTDPPSAHPILVLERDLILSSRVTATARALGVPVEVIRDPVALEKREGRRLIVDLNQPGALEAAAAWQAAAADREVIGFVSHVDADTIARARAAGLQRVLPRSRFVEQLHDLLDGRDDTARVKRD